ncbi:MAG: fused MFS/spermidine synthase [Archangium sp.]|nr:fused MFS/spermidine synthase [Archangium sp.]
MRRQFLLGLLIFSGLAGLSYELLWVRMLSWSMGSTTASFATVLAVYFGGLALGSRWAGKKVQTATRPVFMYGALEALTGVFGLISYPLMSQLGSLFAVLDPGVGAGALALRFGVAVVVLLPPTFLMGATLPFVCAAMLEDDEQAGRGAALIYGLNTVGACLGAYVLTFLLLPALGVWRSLLTIAAINFCVAGISYWRSKVSDGAVATPAPTDTGQADDSKEARVTTLLAWVAGFVAVGAQVVWGRMYGILLKGTVYGIGTVLIAVLLGIALGSLIAAWLARGKALGVVTGLVVAFYLLGLTGFVWTTPFAHYVLDTLATPVWTPLQSAHAQLVVVVVMLAPATISSGALLPLLVALARRSARGTGTTLARLYATNTLGSILGSVAIGYYALPALGSASTLYALVLLLTVVLALFLVVHGAERPLLAGLTVLFTLVMAGTFPELRTEVAVPGAPLEQRDYFTARAALDQAAKTMRFVHEGDVATVIVADMPGTTPMMGLSLNGLGQGSRRAAPPELVLESTLVAAVPWVHVEKPQRALVVGLGGGATLDVLQRLSVPSIEVLELESGVVEAVNTLWGDENPLSRPGVKVVVNDARQHLLINGARGEKYDLICSMPAHPWVAPALFTQDFFELAARNLKPGGVFSTWFSATSSTAARALVGGFVSVFPHYLVYEVPEAGALYLVGSTTPFKLDVARLEALEKHDVMTGYGEQTRSRWFLPLRLVAASDTPRAAPAGTLINTDDNAYVEFFAKRRFDDKSDPLIDLPVRYLPPSRLESGDREGFYLELVERLLETPEGRLPARRESPPNVVRSLTALVPQLPERLQKYVELRLALGSNQGARAAALLPSITDPELAARAKKMLAGSEATDVGRRSALRELTPRTPDVAGVLVALGEAPEPVVVEGSTDPLRYLFDAGPVEDNARAGIEGALLARLTRFANGKLYDRCKASAAERKWPVLEQECQLLGISARREDAQRAMRRGVELYEAGRFADALELLSGSHQVVPLSDDHLRLMLALALRQNDGAKLERARESFMMRGYTPQAVARMEVLARSLPEKGGALSPLQLPATPGPGGQ